MKTLSFDGVFLSGFGFLERLFAKAVGVFVDVDGDICVFLKDAARHVLGDRALRKRVDIVRLEAFLTKAN